MVLKVGSLKIYQQTKFYGSTSTGESFASTSELSSPSVWICLSYGIKYYGVEVTFSVMTSQLNFLNFTKLFGSFGGREQTQTDRQ
jgi:hypothetical protein